MKIVHIAPSLARGGGERLMIELANAASAAGHKVTIVLGFDLPPDRLHGGLRHEVDIRIIRREAGSPPGRYIGLTGWIWRHRKWLAGQDVIHCHMTLGAIAGTLARWVMPRRGPRPVIVETYHAIGMPIPKTLLRLHAWMLAGRDAVAFMVDHPDWADFGRRHPRLLTRVIPAGVPVPANTTLAAAEKAERRRAFGLPEQGVLVGTVGRLVAERQPWLYIPAFARIAGKLGNDVQFVIGGDGDQEPALRRLVSEHGLDGRVHFIGLVRDMEHFLPLLDLYISLNVGPVPGVAGLQAVAAGVPVIAVQIQPEYQGSEDWIWSGSEPANVGDKAIELLRSQRSLDQLRAAQRAHLDASHSASAMASDYERLYRDASAHRSNRNRV